MTNKPDVCLHSTQSLFSRNKFWQDSLILQKQTSSLLVRELRSTIAFPRTVPRQLREKIAEVITCEVLFGQPYEIKDPERFIGIFGAFYPIFLTLKNSKAWPKLRKIAKKSRGAGIASLKILLPLIYDIMERSSEPSNSALRAENFKKLDAGMDAILMKFQQILKDTLLMWENSSCDDGRIFQGTINSAEGSPGISPRIYAEGQLPGVSRGVNGRALQENKRIYFGNGRKS